MVATEMKRRPEVEWSKSTATTTTTTTTTTVVLPQSPPLEVAPERRPTAESKAASRQQMRGSERLIAATIPSVPSRVKPDPDPAETARRDAVAFHDAYSIEQKFSKVLWRTPEQMSAMREAHDSLYGTSLDVQAARGFIGTGFQIADTAMRGDSVTAAAQLLHWSIDGAGTDEDLIFSTLKDIPRDQMPAVKAKYEALYGVTLKEDLKGDLGGRREKLALKFL